MRIDPKVESLLDRAQSGRAPSQSECAFLLGFSETSLESAHTRVAGDTATRLRFGDHGLIFAQIGIEIAPCPGACKFCSFAAAHTAFAPSVMSDAELLSKVEGFTATGELDALFLMTMHTFDFARLTRLVALVRGHIAPEIQLVVNIGDFDADQARDLKAAGVTGAYHVLRLREGTDTALDPERRKATIRAIKDGGLDFWYCCEPVGPEHTPEELAEQLFLGVRYGCVGHAAMRRVHLPSSPLSGNGQISELRLAQVTAVVALATLACPETRAIGVHEPSVLGLTSGANSLFAEAGANPRDTQGDTAGHRGRDIGDCKTMLYEAGFADLKAAARRISLADAYRKTADP
jgi:biotin synthase